MQILKKLIKDDIRMFPTILLGLFYFGIPLLCITNMFIQMHVGTGMRAMQMLCIVVSTVFYVFTAIYAVKIIKHKELTSFFNDNHESWWTMLLSGLVIGFGFFINNNLYITIAFVVVIGCLYSSSLRHRYTKIKGGKNA